MVTLTDSSRNSIWDSVTEIFEAPGQHEARKSAPCPICGKPDWCLHSGKVALCHRIPDGSLKTYATASGDAHLHVLDGSTASYVHPGHLVKKTKPQPDADQLDQKWGDLARRCEGRNLDALSVRLGVPTWALRTLGMGWDGEAWTVPERAADGRVRGVKRRFPDGSKFYCKGSKTGLTYDDNALERPGPILLVEGASDVAAAIAMGFAVVGRPSCTGGIDDLVELLIDVPEAREVIVLAENDRKEDGRWPGRDGAIATAAKLTEKLGRIVTWSLPPTGSKDLRAWYNAHSGEDDGIHLNDLFLSLIDPKLVPLGSECRSYSITASTVKAYRATATSLPSLPRYSGRKCPRALKIDQRKTGGDLMRTIHAPCRSRTCPICSRIWGARYTTWFTWILGQHEQLHMGEVHTDDWKTVTRAIQRAGGDYVAIEVMPSKRVLITTVPVLGTMPIDQQDALELIGPLVHRARPVRKPITTSKGWRLREKEPDILVGDDQDQPTEEVVDQVEDVTENKAAAGDVENDGPDKEPDPPEWKTIRKRKRVAIHETAAGLKALNIDFEAETQGANVVFYWRIPKGVTDEDLVAICNAIDAEGRKHCDDPTAADLAWCRG